MSLEIKNCRFVDGSSLIPEDWKDWFWEHFSEAAPFSYGDNNRTLVSPEDFSKYVEDWLDEFVDDDEADTITFRAKIEELIKLQDVYIDLEN